MFSVVRTVAVAMASLFGSNIASWSFPFNFDIARRYAEHANCQNSHYGEQRYPLKPLWHIHFVVRSALFSFGFCIVI